MHIDYLRDDGTGRAVVHATQGADDAALAIDQLILDVPPRGVHDDRMAVAAMLLFGGRAASEISFPRKISQELAETVNAVYGVRTISKVAKPKRAALDAEPEADADAPLQVTTLTVGPVTGFAERTPGVDRARLGLVPGERFQGALFGIKEAIVSSNAWLLADVFDPTDVMLAVGVIYSEDFLARELQVELEGDSEARASEGARQLCAAVGLGVS